MAPQHRNLIAKRRGLTFWTQWTVGMLLACLLLSLVVQARYGTILSQYRVLGILTLLGSVHVYALLQVYHKRHRLLSGLLRLLAGWLLLLGSLLAIALVTHTVRHYSLDLVFHWAVLGFLVQALSYVPLHVMNRLHARKLRNERRSVIVGTGPLAQELAQNLSKPHRVPLVGMIATAQTHACVGLPILGDLSNLREILAQQHIRRVYIALPLNEMPSIERIYIDLLDLHVDVVWIPDFGSMLLLNHSISEIGPIPAIYLNETPLSSHPGALLGKEILERSLAALAIVLLSPLLLTTALAVKLTSPGPVLFKQKRHGWNGEVINIWKFRTMREHQDDLVQQATRGDQRVTAVGRFLRRTSLDELPQLFNVVAGEMALVGPRPHAVPHNLYYIGKIHAYMARHRIKPGMTGLAQITGHRGETATVEKMQQRINQDLLYINQWSFWLDFKILLKTPFTLLSKDIY